LPGPQVEIGSIQEGNDELLQLGEFRFNEKGIMPIRAAQLAEGDMTPGLDQGTDNFFAL
jgi:hypothetical protein